MHRTLEKEGSHHCAPHSTTHRYIQTEFRPNTRSKNAAVFTAGGALFRGVSPDREGSRGEVIRHINLQGPHDDLFAQVQNRPNAERKYHLYRKNRFSLLPRGTVGRILLFSQRAAVGKECLRDTSFD